MPKELPWFMFKVNAWNTGDIQLLSFHLKGVFIDLCSYYWSKNCAPSASACEKKCGRGNFIKLVSNGVVKQNGDSVNIEFLDEQWNELLGKSAKATESANKRWNKKGPETECERNANASSAQCERNAIREDNIRVEKNREDNIKTGFAKNNFFRIGIDLHKQPVSEWFKKNKIDFLEQWLMKQGEEKNLAQKVFEKLDERYFGYDFNNENHIVNAFTSTWVKVKNENKTSVPGSKLDAVLTNDQKQEQRLKDKYGING